MKNQILPPDTFTKEQVARGAEARWYKFYIKFTLVWLVVLSALGGLVFALVKNIDNFDGYTLFLFGFAIIVFLIYLLYNVSGYREILRCVGKLPICKVRLTNPQRKWFYRRGQLTYYFTVKIETENGTFEAKTDPMFAIGLIAPIRLHDYENQEVYVYFDEEERKVYVIDLVGNLPIPDGQNDKTF